MFEKVDFVGYIKKWLKEIITQFDILHMRGTEATPKTT